MHHFRRKVHSIKDRKSFEIQDHFSSKTHDFPINSLATNFYSVLVNCIHVIKYLLFSECKYANENEILNMIVIISQLLFQILK